MDGNYRYCMDIQRLDLQLNARLCLHKDDRCHHVAPTMLFNSGEGSLPMLTALILDGVLQHSYVRFPHFLRLVEALALDCFPQHGALEEFDLVKRAG